MFGGFWGWFFVIVIVACIFGAGRLPEIRKFLEGKYKEGIGAVQKGKKELEAKVSKIKEKKEAPAKEEDNHE